MVDPVQGLSRRERQIMQVIYARGKATAKQIVEEIPDPPTRTAVRTMLSILVEKKVLRYHKEGREFVYSPVRSPDKARQGALRNVLSVFFSGSIESLVASHLSDPNSELDEVTLKRLEKMIRDARRGEQKQ